MKKFLNKLTRKHIRALFLLLLYALIITAAFQFLRSYTRFHGDKLNLTPLLDDAKGWDIFVIEDGVKLTITLQELLADDAGTVYLSRRLTKDMEDAGITILELDSVSWQQSVFLDGGLLYTVRPELDNLPGSLSFPGDYEGVPGRNEYVRLTLPPHYAGKTLTIAAARSGTGEYYGGSPMIRFSSNAVNEQLTITSANSASMPAAAYMTGALLLLGLFFFAGSLSSWEWPLLLLALAGLIQALRHLLNFEYLFSTGFSLNIAPAPLLHPLFLSLPMLFLLVKMRRWRRWYAPFLLLPMALSCVPFLAALIPNGPVVSETPFLESLYVSLAALAVFSCLEARDHNPLFRLFTPCLAAVAALTGLTACGGAYFGPPGAESYLLTVLRQAVTHMPSLPQYYCGLILFLLCAGCSFVLVIKNTMETQSRLRVAAAKNELMLQNLQEIQKSGEKLAQSRHNMLRHLTALADLNRSGEYLRLGEYLDQLTRETEAIPPLKLTAHPIVNAVAARALEQAGRADIRMDIQLHLPERLPIPDSDLCSFLTNLLDNAVEAASSMSPGRDRWIEFTMHIRGRYLFIEAQNSCSGAADFDAATGLCLSTKGPAHGYGMKTMEAIARRYHSRLQVEAQPGVFLVRTALLMPNQPAPGQEG